MTSGQKEAAMKEAQNLYQLACNKFNDENYIQAIDLFTKSIKIFEAVDYIQRSAYNNRGIAFLALEQYENALKDFTNPNATILEFNKTDLINYYTNIGFAYYNLSKSSEAKFYYEKVLKLDPNDTDAKYILSQLK